MSNRQLLRSVAKARLKAMGVEHVNDCLNVGMSHTKNQNLQRTKTGRALLAKLQKRYPPMWLRITVGDLAKEGYNAQMGIGKRRKYRVVRR